MAFRPRRLRVSTKVVLSFVAIVLFQGIGSLLILTTIVTRANGEAFESQIRRAVQSAEAFVEDAVKDAAAKSSLLAGQEKIVEYVQQGRTALLGEELGGYRNPLKIDGVVAFDAASRVLAYHGEPWMPETAAAHDFVQNYRDGNPVFILPYDRWIFLWVVSPVIRDRNIIGYLASTVKLDRNFIARMEDVAGAQVMLSWKNKLFPNNAMNDGMVLSVIEKYYGKDFPPAVEVRGFFRSHIYRVARAVRLQGLYAFCFLDTQPSLDLLRQYKTISMAFLAVVIASALIIAVGLYRLTFMRSMSHFMEGVRRVAMGDLSFEIDTRAEDEFGELSRAFGHMTRSLAQRERELAELGSYNSLILTSVPAGVLAVAPDGRITACNPSAAQAVGVRAEELLSASSYVASPLPDELVAIIAEGIDQRRYCSLKDVRISGGSPGGGRPGGGRILTVSTSPLPSSGGAAPGAVIILADVTRERSLEERLEISSRMAAMGEMVAGVAHQIRNPLAVMKVGAEMLRDKCGPSMDDQVYRKLLSLIVGEIDSLSAVIANFLDFARPLTVRKEPVPVAEMVSRVIALLPHEHAEKVCFVRRFEDGLGSRYLDPMLMEQVLSNLLSNAAEASAPGQSVLVSGRLEADGLVIEVADRGKGMDEATRKKVFTPFFTTKEKGTGLGLSIVHRLVEVHGGTISFTSAPGEGTAFTIHI